MNIAAQHKAQSILPFPCVARSILYWGYRAYLTAAPCGALQSGLTDYTLCWTRIIVHKG